MQEAFALSATPKQVACACSQGVVRLFASKSLQFRANLPYYSAAGVWPGSMPLLCQHTASHLACLGCVCAAAVSHLHVTPNRPALCCAGDHDSCHFADARACAFGAGSQCDSMLLVVYSNSEMIMWDIHDLAQVGAQHALRKRSCRGGRQRKLVDMPVTAVVATHSLCVWQPPACRSSLCAALPHTRAASGTCAASRCLLRTQTRLQAVAAVAAMLCRGAQHAARTAPFSSGTVAPQLTRCVH